MIWNLETGKRMRIDGELKPFHEAFTEAFKNESHATIRTKPQYMLIAKIYRGKDDVNGKLVGDRKVDPLPSKCSPYGEYKTPSGQKEKVIYCEQPPSMNNGIPSFNAKNLELGNSSLEKDNEKALFFWAFSNKVDGGLEGKITSPTARYEFVSAEKVADKRIFEMNQSYLEKEITIESTRMKHDKVKDIMSILNVPVDAVENVNRLRLYDYLKAGDKALIERYEKAKQSVTKEMPKYDLSNVSDLVKDAIKKEVVIDDNGWWTLVKSDVLSDKITETLGGKKAEREFALKEFLTTNPAWVDEIKKYVE
jgi:hypothetical protein